MLFAWIGLLIPVAERLGFALYDENWRDHLTQHARALYARYEAAGSRWTPAPWYMQDLTDEDVASFPPFMVPGIKALLAHLSETDPYVWREP